MDDQRTGLRRREALRPTRCPECREVVAVTEASRCWISPGGCCTTCGRALLVVVTPTLTGRDGAASWAHRGPGVTRACVPVGRAQGDRVRI